MNKLLKNTVNAVQSAKFDISFTMLEVGAVSLSETPERFYELLDYFPDSKIIGFELDEDVCHEMNSKARKGIQYFPYALGESNETRQLYITNHPMCTSLYKPNEKLLSLYQNMEVAYLKTETSVETVSLDHFVKSNNLGKIDFIKIDVQGAELDIFKGGTKTLSDVLKIVCEVEFVEHYENQPLFGDVCEFLAREDLMFNKFLGFGGRALKPIVLQNNPNYASQYIWSDAVYIKHVLKIPELDNAELLKLAVLSAVYGSADLVHYCLSIFDKKNSSSLSKLFIETA